MIRFQGHERWQKIFGQVLANSRFDLPNPLVDKYFELAFDYTVGYLRDRGSSVASTLDPVGDLNLRLAKKVRRRAMSDHTADHPDVLQQMADEGHPEIVVLESDARRPIVAERWHSDVTFEKRPPLGSILRAVAVPAAGGDTLWASMYAAWEALSDAMQRLVSGLTAFHDGGGFARIARDDAQREDLASRQSAVHPVVRTHPVTGRKGLFVNSVFTKHIVGMKPAESRALLGFLTRHIETPDFSCRFRWRKDSIAMWDNRCTQHRVVADALSEYRRMERVTLIGDEPR